MWIVYVGMLAALALAAFWVVGIGLDWLSKNPIKPDWMHNLAVVIVATFPIWGLIAWSMMFGPSAAELDRRDRQSGYSSEDRAWDDAQWDRGNH